MNLTVDIGNTNIMICIFKNDKIIYSIKINVSKFKKVNQKSFLRKIFSSYKISNVLISSVVPDMTKCFIEILEKFKIHYFQTKNLLEICGLKTNLKNKKTIGDDRLINIIYAKKLYSKSIMIIDFGTATTIDILDKHGVYDGGVITPGIELSLKSLKEGTAKLPLVNFKKTRSIIGKSTKEAIQSGFFWGYISMMQGLVSKIVKEKKHKFDLILTGGNSKTFKECFDNVIQLDEFFNSKGLNYLINTYLKEKHELF